MTDTNADLEQRHRMYLGTMAAQIAAGITPNATAAARLNGDHAGIVARDVARWAMEIVLEIDSLAKDEAGIGRFVPAPEIVRPPPNGAAAQAAYNEYCARAPDGYRSALLPWSDLRPDEQTDWIAIAERALAAALPTQEGNREP